LEEAVDLSYDRLLMNEWMKVNKERWGELFIWDWRGKRENSYSAVVEKPENFLSEDLGVDGRIYWQSNQTNRTWLIWQLMGLGPTQLPTQGAPEFFAQGVDTTVSSSAEVKERIARYPYSHYAFIAWAESDLTSVSQCEIRSVMCAQCRWITVYCTPLICYLLMTFRNTLLFLFSR
jgi:hypothetical protein